MLKYLRNLFYPAKELEALDANIAATTNVADPCEKLLRYDDLARSTDPLAGKIGDRSFYLFAPIAAAGTISLGIGLAIISMPLVLGGLAVAAGSFGILGFGGSVSMDKVAKRRGRCSRLAEELIENTSPQDLAASPRFEAAMKRLPPLAKKFEIAALREKFAPSAPAAPAPSATPAPR